MINISDAAADRLKGILVEEGLPDAALRVIVVPNGHHGAQYMLALEDAPKDDDMVMHENGVRVVVDTDSVPLIEGAEIDYAESLMRSGFVISNPNIAPSGGGCACGGNCGCGAQH